MARILMLGPVGEGHVNPVLGVLRALVDRGHEVHAALPELFRERVVETGTVFHSVPSTWESMSDDPPLQMHGAEFIKAIGHVHTETRHMVDAVSALPDLPVPDLVLHDGPIAWWGRILAARWGVPRVETWPNLVANRHWSMRDYVRINPLDPRFLLVAGRLARYLRSEGVRHRGRLIDSEAPLRLVLLPREFQPRGETFEPPFLFTGPALAERRFQGRWSPPPDAPRILLVAMGTAYTDHPGFYRGMIAGAADRPDWHLVLATGNRIDPTSLDPLPPNAEAHVRVPQLAVLGHASAFVTHAGMGSTLEGLAHEVPLVAVPRMAEQQANADRIAALGLGVHVPERFATPEAVWRAVEQVAGNPRIAGRLAWMRECIESAAGGARAAEAIEGVLGAG